MLECRILTAESEIEALAGQWRELHARIGRSPFSGYDIVSIWWNIIGKTDPQRRLHVVAGYEGGKLAAALPLTVVHRKGLRIMQAAGYQAYNYCDMLAGDADQAFRLWQAARQSPRYDFADIRDVYPESACCEALGRFARQRDLTDAFALRSKWTAGKDWVASLSGHTRSNFKRYMRRLEEKGPVRFEACHGHMPPPEIVEDMVRQKTAWAAVHEKRGLFEHPDVLSYFRNLLEKSAGSLFLGWVSCGGRAIAYNQGLIHQGVLHSIVWTYNPDWVKYSPGHIVLVQSLQWAIDQGLQMVDLRQGASQLKRLHSNEKRQCAEFTFNGSARGRIIENAYMAVRGLMRTMRGDPAHAAGED